MDEKNHNMMYIVAIVAIVAIIALIVLVINMGKQQSTSASLSNVGAATGPTAINSVTKQDVLNMLNSCGIFAYERVNLDPDGLTTGDGVCRYHHMTCIAAEIFYDSHVDQPPSDYTTLSTGCNIRNDPNALRTVCCTT